MKHKWCTDIVDGLPAVFCVWRAEVRGRGPCSHGGDGREDGLKEGMSSHLLTHTALTCDMHHVQHIDALPSLSANSHKCTLYSPPPVSQLSQVYIVFTAPWQPTLTCVQMVSSIDGLYHITTHSNMRMTSMLQWRSVVVWRPGPWQLHLTKLFDNGCAILLDLPLLLICE